MTPAHSDRRVFLEVKDAAAVLSAMDSAQGMFVPTRLALPLGGLFMLALRLPRVGRAVEIPMLVLGRRVPRGGSLLSGGVNCRPADRDHGMVQLLREVAAGRVVDLEARILEQTRIPTAVTFHTTAEVEAELHALMQGPTQLALETPLQRGDRAVLTFASLEHGVLLAPHVLVRAVHHPGAERLASVELLDERQRALVAAFLQRRRPQQQRA